MTRRKRSALGRKRSALGRRMKGGIEVAGSLLATYDLATSVGHPGWAMIFMIASIYLVVLGAWDLAA